MENILRVFVKMDMVYHELNETRLIHLDSCPIGYGGGAIYDTTTFWDLFVAPEKRVIMRLNLCHNCIYSITARNNLHYFETDKDGIHGL